MKVEKFTVILVVVTFVIYFIYSGITAKTIPDYQAWLYADEQYEDELLDVIR